MIKLKSLLKEILNAKNFWMFNYYIGKPPTDLQMRNLKNFAIENHWSLHDVEKNKDVEL